MSHWTPEVRRNVQNVVKSVDIFSVFSVKLCVLEGSRLVASGDLSGHLWVRFRSDRRGRIWTRHHVGKQWNLRGEEEEEARPEKVG